MKSKFAGTGLLLVLFLILGGCASKELSADTAIPEDRVMVDSEGESAENSTDVLFENIIENAMDDYHPDRSIAPNRVFYYKGEQMNMPCTVGDLEKLVGSKIMRVNIDYSGGMVNFNKERVGEKLSQVSIVLDTSEISELDSVPTIGIEATNPDDLELLEKIKDAPLLEFSLNDFDTPLSLQENFSLFPDQPLFDGKETLDNKLAKYFGGNISGSNVKVNKFQDGYSLSTGSITLYINYVPDSVLAYYEFLRNERSVYIGNEEYSAVDILLCNEEGYGNDYVEMDENTQQEYYVAMADLTGDGIRELLIYNGESSFAIGLNKETKRLEVIVQDTGRCGVTDKWLWVKPEPVDDYYDFNNTYYLIDLDGNRTQIAELTKESNNYFINNRAISGEEQSMLESKLGYSHILWIGSSDEQEIEDMLFMEEWTFSVDIDNAHKRKREGDVFRIEDFDEYRTDASEDGSSMLAEGGSHGDGLELALEEYKAFLSNRENLRPLLEEYMGDGLEVCPSMVTGFCLKDLSEDGIPELLIEKVLTSDWRPGEHQAVYIYTYDGQQGFRLCGDFCSSGNYGSIAGESGRLASDLEQRLLTEQPDYANSILYSYDGPMRAGFNAQNHLVFFEQGVDLGLSITMIWGNISANMEGGSIQTDFYMEDAGIADIEGDPTYYEVQGSREKCLQEMEGYTPFRFYDITEENINKYIVPDYENSGMYDYTAEDVLNDSMRRDDEVAKLFDAYVYPDIDGKLEGNWYYNLEYLVQFIR